MVGRDVVCRPRGSAEPNTTGNDRTPSLETPMLRIVRSRSPWDKPTRLSLRINLSHFQKVSNASASNGFIFLRPLSSPPGVPWLTECEFCEAKLQLLAHWHRESPAAISCLPVWMRISLMPLERPNHPIGCRREAGTCHSTPSPLNLSATTALLRGGVREVVTLRPTGAGTDQAEPQGRTTGKVMSLVLKDEPAPGGYRRRKGTATESGQQRSSFSGTIMNL